MKVIGLDIIIFSLLFFPFSFYKVKLGSNIGEPYPIDVPPSMHVCDRQASYVTFVKHHIANNELANKKNLRICQYGQLKDNVYIYQSQGNKSSSKEK